MFGGVGRDVVPVNARPEGGIHPPIVFKDADLKEMGESLPPGSSAIIAIAEDRMIQQLESGLAGYQKIAKHVVSADAAAAIVAEVEDTDE